MATAVKTRSRKRELNFEPDLGKRVSERRHDLGFSQAVLAGEVGCTQQQIALIEGGRISVRLPQLRNIADALGVDYRNLLP